MVSDDAQILATAELATMTLAQWYEGRGISRATAFRLTKAAGIVPHKVRAPGSRAPVSGLDPQQVAALDALAARLQAGATLPQIEAAAASALAARSPSEPVLDDPETVSASVDVDALQARLEAAERAIRTGLPLTTKEVGWILGAKPGAEVVTRGRITAHRHARNVWSLDRHWEDPEQS